MAQMKRQHVLADGHGIPLAMVTAPANRHNMNFFEATLKAQGIVSPDLEDGELRHLCLDRGYDYEEVRKILDYWGYEGHTRPKMFGSPIS